MASGVSIQVQGLDSLRKKFGQIPTKVTARLDIEMGALANDYENRAAEAAPVDTGRLKGGISSYRIGSLNHEVVSQMPYSAYVEFGTITHVNVPADLVQYAAKFKGKGINKSGGMRAHPFFFPHLPWARTELIKRSEKVVANALK
jgi:hypothetical protein